MSIEISNSGYRPLMCDLVTNKHTEVFEEVDFQFNAPHSFVVKDSHTGLVVGDVHFQEGPVKENGVNGVANEDLIGMVIRRLQCFQNSEFTCRENAVAITKLEESLMWLRKRTNGREQRGVEGTRQI